MDKYLGKAVLHTDALLQAKYNHSAQVIYVSLVKYLCNSQGCITYLNGDRKEDLITYDYGHFTLVVSDYVGKSLLMPVIKALINSNLR
jgi:hypothetical protein